MDSCKILKLLFNFGNMVPTRGIEKVYFEENNFLETYTSRQISLTATSFPVGFITYFFIKSMIAGLKVAELNSNEMAVCRTE